jgi:histidinol-phosphatase (PHP family)
LGDLRRYYQPAVEALAKRGTAFEINTAGLRKEVKEAYPAFEFLKLAHEAGVGLVINSDAHAPNEVGYRFDLARDLAQRAGYTKVCRFEERRHIEVDL